jgi:hypothetical protein
MDPVAGLALAHIKLEGQNFLKRIGFEVEEYEKQFVCYVTIPENLRGLRKFFRKNPATVRLPVKFGCGKSRAMVSSIGLRPTGE